MDRLFRENLLHYSQDTPKEVWNRIEQSILMNRKRIVLPLYFKIAASILLISGLATLTWRYLDKNSNRHQVANSIMPSNEQSLLPLELSKNDAVIKAQREPAREAKTANTVKLTDYNRVASSEVTAKTVPSERLDEQILPAIENNPDSDPKAGLISSEQDTIVPEITEPQDLIIAEEKLINTIVSNDLIIQQNLMALGQTDEETKNQHTVIWSVGGQAGPQYSYRDVYINSTSNQINNFNEYEKGVIAYAGGFQVEMEPSKRFSVQSGIYYSKIGQIKNNVQIEDRRQIADTWFNPGFIQENKSLATNVVNSTGNITFDNSSIPPVSAPDNNEWVPGIITAEQYFEFIEVPFVCSYKIIDKKMDVSLNSGLWADFLVGNKASATDNQNFSIEGTTEDINKFNYSASVAIGIDYPISRRLIINFQPLFKYYLTPINTNPQTEVYPYSFSLLTGIQYAF
jgi:hypothetical protein